MTQGKNKKSTEASEAPDAEGIAEHGLRFAQNLRDAAGSQKADSFQGRLLEIVASGVSDLSENLRDRNLSSLLSQAEGIARRNPTIFVAGAAAAGFAVTRYLMSSGDRKDVPADSSHSSDNLELRSAAKQAEPPTSEPPESTP